MELAVESLNAAIGDADALYSTGRLQLHGGLSGLGWTIEHLAHALHAFGDAQAEEASSLNDDTDAALLQELERGRWGGTADVATGLAGFGIYFLARHRAPAARRGLALVLGHLDEMSWRPRPAGGSAPAPCVSLGEAGTAHFLSAALSTGVDMQTAARLLDQVLETLLAGPADRSRARGGPDGDLGVAAVCLQLGRQNNHPDCARLGQDLLEQCLLRSPESHPDCNLSLISGAAGICHAFNRIWNQEGDERCRNAALEWLDAVLEGWDGNEIGRPESNEFLGGAAGIGLSLQAVLTPTAPAWDRLLCLSSGD